MAGLGRSAFRSLRFWGATLLGRRVPLLLGRPEAFWVRSGVSASFSVDAEIDGYERTNYRLNDLMT